MTKKMAEAKIKAKSNKKSSNNDQLVTDYCDDCLYNWCTKRNKVTYCSMKTKGLFECRLCILKLMSSYEKEIYNKE